MSDQDFASEFPILSRMDFFNHAGVAPISRRAADALRRFADQAEQQAYFGSGWYARAKQTKQLAARLIGAAGEHEIAFVPNTSAGIALVARGLTWRAGDDVVITDVEYPANRYPWIDLKRFGVRVIEVPQDKKGRIHAEDVADAITSRTRVVSISHVQYASGCRTDLRPIADMVHQAGGYLCVDAIQSLGAMPFDVNEHGVDFLAADGHKWLLGPEGAGIFYCREDLAEMLHPAVVGWMNMVDAQDYGNYRFEFQQDARRFEPGSWNLPGIHALGASIELLLEIGLDEVWRRIHARTSQLCEGLAGKGYRVFSPRAKESECSGIIVFEPPHREGEDTETTCKRIVQALEKRNIIIVVRNGRLRASIHFYNTAEQVDRLIDALP
jgi:selenocysteine lyase/cysteine desulfurase